ncbi:uncharacterized protein [Littorina saxatilis]|uniref:uncharacterized protein n=1 Tax=Littorina saxatilis TaxID=31220 RepID=UPI0038B5ECAF
MTVNGIFFALEAYPTPDDFAFTHLGTRFDVNGSRVSSNGFAAHCQQDQNTEYKVNCGITPVNVPRELVGLYRADLSNGIGSVDIAFQIQTEVVKSISATEWPMFGGVVAAVVVCAAIVIVVFVICRKRLLQRVVLPQRVDIELSNIDQRRHQHQIHQRRQHHQRRSPTPEQQNDLPQPQLPPPGVPISSVSERDVQEQDHDYTRVSGSSLSSLHSVHSYDSMLQPRPEDLHTYTDLNAS